MPNHVHALIATDAATELGQIVHFWKSATRRRINDHLRKQYRRVKVDEPPPGSTSQTARLARIPDPASLDLDAIWDEEWKRQLLDTAVQRVKNQVDAKQFQIFDCYVRKEWPAQKVAVELRVSVGQVYLARHRISALLKREVKALEKNIG